MTRRRALIWILAGVMVAGAGSFWWMNRGTDTLGKALDLRRLPLIAQWLQQKTLPEGFAASNGRIEATEIDIATKLPGRLAEVLVEEGHLVEAGQPVARMDTASLRAQLAQAEAEWRRAQLERDYARALVAQQEEELGLARNELRRLRQLVTKGNVSVEQLDQAQTRAQVAAAGVQAAKVKVVASEAAIEAAVAAVERIRVDINDSELKSPKRGRVLFRLAEPGEVLGSGGKILTLLDVADLYMVIFLPEKVAGQVPLGGEARLIFDAAPEYVVPASVSFVAARAQFTPKQVETRSEREKLSFRVKLKIPEDILRQYESRMKTGLPGEGFVRLLDGAAWPEHLQPRLP